MDPEERYGTAGKHVHRHHFEQPWIGRTVRCVATRTTLGLHRHVLVYERSLFVDMAFVADGVAARQRPRLPQNPRSIRVVAVIALHQSLIDAMMIGLGKIRPWQRYGIRSTIAAHPGSASALFPLHNAASGNRGNRHRCSNGWTPQSATAHDFRHGNSNSEHWSLAVNALRKRISWSCRRRRLRARHPAHGTPHNPGAMSRLWCQASSSSAEFSPNCYKSLRGRSCRSPRRHTETPRGGLSRRGGCRLSATGLCPTGLSDIRLAVPVGNFLTSLTGS